MKHFVKSIFLILSLVSCETLKQTYEQQWKPELGEKEQQQIESFNKEPEFFRKSKIPSSDELQDYIDDATSSPTDCLNGLSPEEINSGDDELKIDDQFSLKHIYTN